MSPYLKWPLAALTLIGAILGAGLTLLTLPLLNAEVSSPAMLPFLVACAFYAIGIIAGLRFAQDDSRRRLLRLYYALQIPWLSSPLIGLRFTSGANLSAALIGGEPTLSYSLGSIWHFGTASNARWGLGLNLLALLIFLLLRQPHRLTRRKKTKRK